ncbi:diaminopropionate ammonia-lyase family protein [Pseudomassariella vexata]|uniref:Diaminopropionate ammonia-lyase family protein n=1 Tax=Pseudomassariella vexata TaxID=1141098 RepID=A0A1Y2E8D1_9PEZI|nr:diaminopropionate ammonia-lyase family protein [Pseudomassariella vexata]ORY67115.1 diaminopropionate ammonia-lyase family protein [Pseudomassariella vexata]
MDSPVYINPSAKDWIYISSESSTESRILEFHQLLPDYNETKLHALPELAAELGLAHVLLKDESNRFGLPAFKILGASWCVYRVVGDALGIDVVYNKPSIEDLGSAATDAGVSIVTATEGNCGRAVSRMAKYLGIPVRVFVPSYMDRQTRNKIRSEGAEVIEVQGSYDDTIPVIRKEAEQEKVLLVLDVGLEGFEDVPKYFVEGYGTMLAESDRQVLEATGGKSATHAIVPCGAGSIAQAVTEHFKGAQRRSKLGPASIIAVEADTAASLKASLQAGRSISIVTKDTIMCGMNCGTLSTLAWPILKDGVHASVVVTDQESHAAVVLLQNKGVMAGPCGAASVAALKRVCAEYRDILGLGTESIAVLYCTEGPRAYTVPFEVQGRDVMMIHE